MADTEYTNVLLKELNDEVVLEATGKNIVISKILEQVETTLYQNKSIAGVQILGAESVQIDADLKNECWHGKNITVVTKSVYVDKPVTWDVSGKDNDQNYVDNAGSDEDGNGVQGNHGNPGESGGNVLILTDCLKNSVNFSIISNGGGGSKGQDGGNGIPGENGKGIDFSEFVEKYPYTCNFQIYRRRIAIRQTIESFRKDTKVFKTKWMKLENGNSYTGDDMLLKILSNPLNYDIYIKAVTHQEHEITFSYFTGSVADQSFLLVKGSRGKPGGSGGAPGLGGKGGYGGDIRTRNLTNDKEFQINRTSSHGKEGHTGSSGICGKHGIDGYDVGYMDYSFGRLWPIFFGQDLQSKLSLKFYKASSSTRVYCPYKKYEMSEYTYVTIDTSQIKLKQTVEYEERDNATRSEPKHHAFATRKKPMLIADALAAYSAFLSSMHISNEQQNTAQVSSIHNTLNEKEKPQSHCSIQSAPSNNIIVQHDTHNSQKNVECQLETINPSTSYKETDSVQVTVDTTIINEEALAFQPKIIRHVEFEHNVQRKPHTAIQHTAEHDTNHSLNIDFQNLNNWSILKCHIVSRDDLKNLFDALHHLTIRANTTDMTIQSVETLLIEKYKLATVEEINKLLPLYTDALLDKELTAQEAIRYLVEDHRADDKISHPVLGHLKPYIHENSREQLGKVSKYCCEDMKDNIDILKKSFILEIGHFHESPDCIKKIYQKYKTQNNILNTALEVFERLLSLPKYEDIRHLWKMRSADGSTNQELDTHIQNHSFLKILWDHLNNQYKFQYDWTECYKDEKIFNQFCKHIENTGFESKTFRELLALIFNVNFRIYEKDFEEELILQENLNASSKTVVYLLRQATEFVRLCINENHFILQQEREKKDDIYKKILHQIASLNNKQDLDNCFNSTSFTADNSKETSPDVECEIIDPQLILTYFPEEERHELKMRLSKMTSEYIGQEEILFHLLNRFSCEGRHVSSEEIYFFINSILLYCVKGGQDQYTFAWLIAAYPQRNWIDELVLLHLENHFKEQLKEKAKWRQYLAKIQNKKVLMLLTAKLFQAKSLTTDRVETVLYLLSNIQSGSSILEGLELSEWPYILKEIFWLNKLEQLCNVKACEELSTASYYVFSIENIHGREVVEALLKLLTEKEAEQHVSLDILILILSNIHTAKWNLSDEDLQALKINSTSEWINQMNIKYTSSLEERNISQLVELIKFNANSSDHVKINLPNIERSIIEINESIYPINENTVNNFPEINNVPAQTHPKMEQNFTEPDVQFWAQHFKAKREKEKLERKEKSEKGDNRIGERDLQEMLAVIDRAIVLKKRFKLRDTQKLAVLALLVNDRSTLVQVSTGEGKSLIVVAASIIKAMLGEKVDIVTSSPVLAIRDAENNNDIYSLFGIAVSHNCSEDIGKRRDAYMLCQIVYGDLGSFQRDYLLNQFYGKNILGDRVLTNVIVDEVDSMLVDKGNSMLYLSHDIPWMDKLESVYLFIWQQINLSEEIDFESDVYVKYIEEAVLSDLYGMIKDIDIWSIDVKLSDRDRKVIWSRLVNGKFLDKRGMLAIESVDRKKLTQSLTPEFSRYTDRISFLLQETIDRERSIYIPNFLRSFVERHLKQWINSAITAFFMYPGHNYVVDVDRTGTNSDRNANIIILDKDTGTDQTNSQWDEALHQFLQLKHGCKLSMLSLKAVFISNVSYFKLYRQLYGLTGTLGSQTERDLLQEIHNVDFVTIPTSRLKQFHEELPIVCGNRAEWIKNVCNQARLVTEKKKRSVLVICETVKDAADLHNALGEKGATNVHSYVRDYEEFTVAKDDKKLDQGQVIIATNLAGRGTDIRITDALRNAGGLHVLLTYLPGNKRIEEQAFGRAARNGDKGSGQLIIIHSKGMEYSNAKVLELMKARDIEEVLRVSEIKSYYTNRIIEEESSFEVFKKLYERKRKELKDAKVPDEVIKILLTSCLDKWAYCLDKQNKNMFLDQDDFNIKNYLKGALDQFMSTLRNLSPGLGLDTDAWLPWVEGNPAQMVELAKLLCQKSYIKSHVNSFKLLENVIQTEPKFAEAAHYYKAFAIGINGDTTDKSLLRQLKQELRTAAKLFEQHSRFAVSAVSIIGNINEKRGKPVENGYNEQKCNVIDIYSAFIRSIEDIIGKTVTPKSFVNNYGINDQFAEYLMQDLLRNGILKNMKLKKKNISIATLKRALKDLPCTISINLLETFLSNYGTNVSESNFLKDLKKSIEIPGREQFWKILTQQEALYNVLSYVIVDHERMKAVDPSMLDFIEEKLIDNTLKKQTIASTAEQVMLYPEQMLTDCETETMSGEIKTKAKDPDNEPLVFVKEKFTAIVSKEKYSFLKEHRVLSFNKKATINADKLEKVSFSCFDSISTNDFVEKTSITSSDAEIILSELVEANVLRKRSEPNQHKYELAINFDEMPQEQILSCAAYEPVTQVLLEVCFSYRIALQKLKRQLEVKITLMRLKLKPQPHKKLFFHLMDQQIVSPGKVMNGDIEEKLRHSKRNNNDGQGKFKILYNNDKTTAIRSGYQSKLREDNFIEHVSKTLVALRGSLKGAKVAHPTLSSLIEIFGEGKCSNAEEMRVFLVNGLGQLIHVREKQWTKKMVFYTLSVITIGVAQIYIGYRIQLYFAGFMSHVGSAFIDEGMSDIIYACGALKSGYFSWQDYKKHKFESVIVTAASVGIAGLISRGVKVSNFGRKLAQPGLKINKKEVIKMTGKTLKNVVKTRARKELVKQVALKSAEALAFGMVNASIDFVIDNYLENICRLIADTFVEITNKSVEDHSISIRLKEAYHMLGVDKSKQMIDGITDSVVSKYNLVETRISYGCKVKDSIVRGVVEGITKQIKSLEDILITSLERDQLKKLLNKKIKIITVITKVASRIKNLTQVGKVIYFIYTFLDNVDLEMKNNLENLRCETKHKNQLQLNETSQEFILFQNEISEQLKGFLSNEVGNFIRQQMLAPIMKHCSTSVVKFVGNYIKKEYRTHKERKLVKEFNKKTRKNEKKPESSCNTNKQTEEYEKNMLELLRKTRNPALVADIILENMPMDLTCVKASVLALQRVLKKVGENVIGLEFKVVQKNGMEQTFCAPVDGKIHKTITIILDNNHFSSFDSGSQDQSSGTDNNSNDCYFRTLSEAFPILKEMGDKQFRQLIAQTIKDEPEIQHYIRKGYHNLPIKLGAYGGRRKTEVIEESSSTADLENVEEPQYIIKSVYNHFVKRFETFVKYSGIVQKIATETNNNPNDLVEFGKSVYQDHSSKEKGYVQAHLIKSGKINSDFEREHPEMAKIIKNMLGRTQKMPYWANVSSGFGGDCDKNQQEYEAKLVSIDYSKPLTREAEATLRSYRQTFIEDLTTRIKTIESYFNNNKSETPKDIVKKSQLGTFRAVLRKISSTPVANLYQIGNVDMSDEKVSKLKGRPNKTTYKRKIQNSHTVSRRKQN